MWTVKIEPSTVRGFGSQPPSLKSLSLHRDYSTCPEQIQPKLKISLISFFLNSGTLILWLRNFDNFGLITPIWISNYKFICQIYLWSNQSEYDWRLKRLIVHLIWVFHLPRSVINFTLATTSNDSASLRWINWMSNLIQTDWLMVGHLKLSIIYAINKIVSKSLFFNKKLLDNAAKAHFLVSKRYIRWGWVVLRITGTEYIWVEQLITKQGDMYIICL